MADDNGRNRLKNLAQDVRAKSQTADLRQLDRKGHEVVDQIVADLTSPDGMPGLYASRDVPGQVRLRRQGKAGQIVLEWLKPIAALEVTFERFGGRSRQLRYLLDEASDTWRAMEGGSELFEDLSAGLVEVLYPEGKR